MTQRTFPRASGDGYQANQADWDLMARHFVLSGVIRGKLNEYEAFGDSTGMQVKVKSGHAWVDGHFAISDAQETLVVTAADATNPRIDRVVLRLDRTVDPCTLVLAVKAGTPAGSPVAPALTRSDTGIWELSLARIAVGAGVSTITAGNVTDERMYNLPPVQKVDGATPSTTSGSYADVAGMSITKYFHAGDLIAYTSGIITNSVNTSDVIWAVAIDGGAEVQVGAFGPRAANAFGPMAGHAVFQNVAEGEHTLKLRWKVLGGTGEANIPRLSVVSVPKQ